MFLKFSIGACLPLCRWCIYVYGCYYFDFQVLFKNLGVDLKEITPTSLLKDRNRELEGNPDFSNKDVGASQPQIAEVKSAIMSPLNQVELPLEVAPSNSGSHTHLLSQVCFQLLLEIFLLDSSCTFFFHIDCALIVDKFFSMLLRFIFHLVPCWRMTSLLLWGYRIRSLLLKDCYKLLHHSPHFLLVRCSPVFYFIFLFCCCWRVG